MGGPSSHVTGVLAEEEKIRTGTHTEGGHVGQRETGTFLIQAKERGSRKKPALLTP